MKLIRENKEGAYLCILCLTIPLSILYLHDLHRGIWNALSLRYKENAPTVVEVITKQMETKQELTLQDIESRFEQRWELLQAKCVKNKDPQLNNLNQTGSAYWPANRGNIVIDESTVFINIKKSCNKRASTAQRDIAFN